MNLTVYSVEAVARQEGVVMCLAKNKTAKSRN